MKIKEVKAIRVEYMSEYNGEMYEIFTNDVRIFVDSNIPYVCVDFCSMYGTATMLDLKDESLKYVEQGDKFGGDDFDIDVRSFERLVEFIKGGSDIEEYKCINW